MATKLFYVFFFLLGIAVSSLFIYANSPEEKKYQMEFRNDYRIYAFNLPENITFAGEKVPVHDFEVAERLDREMLVNTYWQSQTLLFLKRSNRYLPEIAETLKRNGVPEDFKYLALIESGLTNAISPAGATGFWQFIEGTAKQYGMEINADVDERYHVQKSTEAACMYLKEAHKKFGNWTLVAASYNMGMYGLQKRLDDQQVSSYYDLALNSETSRYVFRILAAKEIMENPQNYGFHFRENHLYPRIKTESVIVDSAVDNWVAFAKDHGITYKALKYFNPWVRNTKLSNRAGKTYYVDIPVEKNIDSFFVNTLEVEEEEIEELKEAARQKEELLTPEEDEQTDLVQHTVKSGETISSISLFYKVKAEDVMKWNDLENSSIKTGQVLTIYLKKVE
ncbi:MAG: transglycosylase SLT domain-containing protein [Bacteroidia bacterium]